MCYLTSSPPGRQREHLLNLGRRRPSVGNEDSFGDAKNECRARSQREQILAWLHATFPLVIASLRHDGGDPPFCAIRRRPKKPAADQRQKPKLATPSLIRCQSRKSAASPSNSLEKPNPNPHISLHGHSGQSSPSRRQRAHFKQNGNCNVRACLS